MRNTGAAADLLLGHERLERLADERHDDYVQAQPFPHIVLDGLVLPEGLDLVVEEFPRPDSADWISFNHVSSKKLATNDEECIPPAARRLLHELNSSIFIDFLEKLTGIEGLIPDPHMVGGGLHQIERGGFLGVHADFNWHHRLRLDRRLNLLLYLNRNWNEAWGGHLELWDREMKTCVERISPLFNRCVIFSTSDQSFHGHPDPLVCPPEVTRKSLALYYYSNGRPAEEASEPHSTLHQRRPWDKEVRVRKARKDRPLRRTLKMFLPPILDEMYRRVRGRFKDDGRSSGRRGTPR